MAVDDRNVEAVEQLPLATRIDDDDKVVLLDGDTGEPQAATGALLKRVLAGGDVPEGNRGLTQNQVDARVREIVDDWAEADDASLIPADKLANAPGATSSEVRRVASEVTEDWALKGNPGEIPAGKLADAGNAGDVLRRTATGKDWEKLPAVEYLSALPSTHDAGRIVIVDEKHYEAKVLPLRNDFTLALGSDPTPGIDDSGYRSAHYGTLTPAQAWLDQLYFDDSDNTLIARLTSFADPGDIVVSVNGGAGITLREEAIRTSWSLSGAGRRQYEATPPGGNTPFRAGNNTIALTSANGITYWQEIVSAGGGGGGLSQGAVDARVRALVKDFAETGSVTPPTAADLAAAPVAGRRLAVGNDGASTAWVIDSAALIPAQDNSRINTLEAFRNEFIVDTALGSETKIVAFSNAGYATAIVVPAARAARHIRVTVFDDTGEADATFTLVLADLRGKPSVSGSPQLSDSNSLSGTGDSGNVYRIAHSAGGHFVTGADTVGTFRFAFVQEDTDATPYVDGIPSNADIDTRADARVAAGVADWAEEGNADAIPAGKLTNAPSGGGGLDQAAVDARVKAGVDDWAETGDTSRIPESKMPLKLDEVYEELEQTGWIDEGNTAADDVFIGPPAAAQYTVTNIQTAAYTQAYVTGPLQNNWYVPIRVPAAKVPQVMAGTLRLYLDEGNFIQSDALAPTAWVRRANNTTYTWYQVRVPILPASSNLHIQHYEEAFLNSDQVDARIQTWARTGNTSIIPAAKLPASRNFGFSLLSDSSHGIALTTTATDTRGAAISLGNDAPDFDDITNGEFFVEASFSVSGAVGGLQLGSAVRDDAIVHASEVIAADAYNADTGINGVKASTVQLNNAAGNKVGDFSVYISRDDTSNSAVAFVAFDSDGGTSGVYGTVTGRVSIQFASTDVSGGGSSQDNVIRLVPVMKYPTARFLSGSGFATGRWLEAGGAVPADFAFYWFGTVNSYSEMRNGDFLTTAQTGSVNLKFGSLMEELPLITVGSSALSTAPALWKAPRVHFGRTDTGSFAVYNPTQYSGPFPTHLVVAVLRSGGFEAL